MLLMSLTLEVSKLSDWLNADAYCRESKGGHAVRGEVYRLGTSRRWTTAAHAAERAGEGSTADWEQGTHGEHDEHACDAGRVEAQRLVEGLRVLQSRKEGIRCGKRCRVPGAQRWQASVVQAACRRGLDCRLGARHGEERTSNM